MLRAARFALAGCVSLTAFGGAALAQQPLSRIVTDGQLFGDVRVRGERIEDGSKTEPAEVASARVRVGFQTAEFQRLSLLVEAEGTAVTGDTAPPGATGYPYPSAQTAGNVELNRIQVSYESDYAYAAVGRQLLEYGDERYVGDEDFRQDDRTFDALYAEWEAVPGATLSYAYAWRMNDTYRDDYLLSDSHLVQLEYIQSNALRAAAFAYLIDLEKAPEMSAVTYGARVWGSLPFWRLVFDYDAQWARQSDWGAATGSFDLDDISAAGTLAYGPLSATARYQRLEGNGVRGVTYPFASRHGQRGWTELFEQGPASGLEAWTLEAEANLSALEFFRGLALQGAVHQYDALLNGGPSLGWEWDAGARVTFSPNVSAALSYADFNGETAGPPDRERVWLELNVRH